MKIRRVGVLLTIVLALGASSATAATKKVTANIKGTLAQSNSNDGACPPVVDANGSDSFGSTCAHPESCKCISATGLPLSGGFGKGTANISVTVDPNVEVSTGADSLSCSPAVAVFTLMIPAKKTTPTRTQTLNALGAVCGTAGTTNVSALGGFSVEASSANPPASGSGTFNGTVSTVGALTIKLTGLITNP